MSGSDVLRQFVTVNEAWSFLLMQCASGLKTGDEAREGAVAGEGLWHYRASLPNHFASPQNSEQLMTPSAITDSNADDVLRAKLNLETATLEWRELQRHFAAGRVIQISPELDLVEVALQLSKDNRTQVQHWLDLGQVAAVTAEQAQDWYARQARLWAVVVAPWVLVQDAQRTGASE